MICDTCIYRNNVEQLKPCIVYRDDCEYYEKERGDMADDLISRQAVLDAIEELKKIHFDRVVVLNKVRDRVLDLSSVNPQEPKTGHWIEKDGFDGDVYYDCSECGESWTTIEGTPWQNGMAYCPNCGAKMVEPQEGEDKE